MTGSLLVIGSVNYDLIFRHRRLPRQGETITGAELFESCGGKGANQAVAAVRCRGGLQSTGDAPRNGTRMHALESPTASSDASGKALPSVLFAGAVGDDAHAAAQLRVFEEDDLDTRNLLILDDVHTGLSVVWVEAGTGDNRIMNSPGANSRLTAGALASTPIEEAGLLLIQNETPADGVRSAVERAHGASVPVIWNPAPIDEASDPGVDPARITWVTPNEVECAVLLGRPGQRIDAASAADAASELLEMGYGGAALTLGPAGVLLAEPGAAPTLVPAPKVEAVDTTGAGDAFNGAFAAALLASADCREAALFGVRYASDSVTRHGTQTSFARW